jgi:hypothetical protein
MASVTELGVANDYDTGRGLVVPDSGRGAPTFVGGWAHIGYLPGTTNCLDWTSNSSSDTGLPIRFFVNETIPVGPVTGLALESCRSLQHVWCAGD